MCDESSKFVYEIIIKLRWTVDACNYGRDRPIEL